MYDWRYIFGNDKNKFDYGNYLQGILGYTFNFDIEGINHKSIMNIFKQYKRLRDKITKEKQFNKKVELNQELNKLIIINCIRVQGNIVFSKNKVIGELTPKVTIGYGLNYYQEFK